MDTNQTLKVMTLLLAGALTAQGAAKQVIIDKTTQKLQGYQNGQLVFESKVSSGRPGKETPSGHYSVQDKQLMHYSRLYDNAPMPYSVHLAGNYFIHGFSYVPNYPASHGCVRLPVDNARQFYQWVDHGTSVRITGQWIPKRQPTRPRIFRIFGFSRDAFASN